MQPACEMNSDWDLLREYVRSGSETAFEALVKRHLGLVYSVAFRDCGDHGLAEEIANNVFLLLAQKAANLKKEIVLAGWLFKTARYTTSNLSSHRRRRLMWEREAAHVEAGAGECLSTDDVSRAWEIVADQLDSVVSELNAADRNAILREQKPSRCGRGFRHQRRSGS